MTRCRRKKVCRFKDALTALEKASPFDHIQAQVDCAPLLPCSHDIRYLGLEVILLMTRVAEGFGFELSATHVQ
jgi:hypothetical protein